MAGANGADHADTFFQLLTVAEQDRLQEQGSTYTYPAGRPPIMKEGTPNKNVTVLMSGLAAAVCVTETRDKVLLRFYRPGDIMGVEAVLDRRLCPETVQPLTDCTVLTIRVEEFAATGWRPEIARAFAMAMVCRARAADDDARTKQVRAPVRLARVLLKLAARAGVPNGDGVDLPVYLPKETIATWIGGSRATAFRSINKLRDQGMISSGRGTIAITDRARLLSFARNG